MKGIHKKEEIGIKLGNELVLSFGSIVGLHLVCTVVFFFFFYLNENTQRYH